MLGEETKGEAIITTGVGQHQMWAAQWYPYREPRHWVTSGGLGSMGFGLPSALGAQVRMRALACRVAGFLQRVLHVLCACRVLVCVGRSPCCPTFITSPHLLLPSTTSTAGCL